MRTTITALFISLLFLMTNVDFAEAQLREDVPSNYHYTGNVLKSTQPENRLFGLVDYRMGHSYEMTFGSFGGQSYNQNIYTNTLHLYMSDRLTGRLDLAVAHSPFGNNIMGNQGPQFFVRNAELNYNLNDRTHFRVSFQQIPQSSLYNPYMHGRHYHPFRMLRDDIYW